VWLLSGVGTIGKVLDAILQDIEKAFEVAATAIGGFFEATAALGRNVVEAFQESDGNIAKAFGKLLEIFGRLMDTLEAVADPVDVATGDVVMDQVDVELPGSLPLVVRRSHRSGQHVGRWLGPLWMCTLDQRLVVTPAGVCFGAEDGMVLAYEHPWLDGEVVWPNSGQRWPLTRDGQAYTISDPQTGQTWRFEPRPGYDVSSDGMGVLPLVLVTNRAGHQITFGYGPDGAPASLTHDGGYEIKVGSSGGRVTSMALAGAGVDGEDVPLVRYGYDQDGNLAEVAHSSGTPLRFAYNDTGLLAGWQDRNGWWYRYHYDEEGRCIRGEGPDGILSATFGYDSERRVTRYTDAAGAITDYRMTPAYRVAAVTDPLGNATTSDYDSSGTLVSQADPLGRVTGCAYDRAGNLIALTRPDGSQITTAYNEQNLPVLITEPDGATWQQEFDDRGNLTRVADPDGVVTSYAYDERGNLASVTDPLGAVTTVVCNAAGLPLAVTEPDGATTRYELDAFGRVTAVTEPDGRVTRMEWTANGLLARQIFPDGAAEHFTYDDEQNLVEHVDAAGAVTRYEYGFMDQMTARVDPNGSRTEYAYDQALRLTSVSHAGLMWRYEYDLAGQLTAQTDYNGATTRYCYDPAGQVTSRVNAAGQQISYAYDLLGNLTEQSVDGVVTTFSHDLAGQLTQAESPDVLVELEYDVAGRVTAETCNGRTVRYEYDPAGQRVRRVTPSGGETRWTYDTAGRQAVMATAGQELRFEYGLAGQETRRHLPGGVTLAQEWDRADQLATQVLTAPAPSGAASRLSSPTLSRLGIAAGPSPGPVLQQRGYTYRADGILTGIDDRLSGPRLLALDATGQITSVTGPGWAETYGYDRAGNITAAAWPASPGAITASADPNLASAPGDDQGPREYAGTLISRAGDVRYEHDAAGRVILRQHARLSRKPDTWRYEWDADDRLTAVTTPDGTRWRYTYDPFGRRIAKLRLDRGGQVSEQTTFTWDGPVLAEQATSRADSPGSAHVTTWDYEPDGFTPLVQAEQWHRASQDQVDQKFYAIITDMIGAPAELISADGDLAGHQQHTLWGTTYWAGTATPLRFPGQYADDETGLHYNCQRYYDPATGRYLTSDPLGLAPAPNPHTYVFNPTLLTDPLGLASKGKRQYVTYTKTHPRTGKVYAGRTMGYGTPQQIVDDRDRNHHKKRYGPALLDKSATATKSWLLRHSDPSYQAIRGREQQLINSYRRQGLSGNSINGISILNPRRGTYMRAAQNPNNFD